MASTFVMIRVECTTKSMADLATKVTDATRPNEGIQQLINLFQAIEGGSGTPAIVDVATRTTTQTITAAGTGNVSATYTRT